LIHQMNFNFNFWKRVLFRETVLPCLDTYNDDVTHLRDVIDILHRHFIKHCPFSSGERGQYRDQYLGSENKPIATFKNGRCTNSCIDSSYWKIDWDSKTKLKGQYFLDILINITLLRLKVMTAETYSFHVKTGWDYRDILELSSLSTVWKRVLVKSLNQTVRSYNKDCNITPRSNLHSYEMFSTCLNCWNFHV
jgi:hypothetical protein